MNARISSLIRNNAAASSAEFALVLPVLLLFLFGIIDIGRYMWMLNQAEKATQMGVRYAVVSDPVATVMNTDFVDFGIAGGDPVPMTTFGSAICNNTSACTVTGAASSVTGKNATAFTDIVNWMNKFDPAVLASNVTVTYQNVGLGYSGDPTGPDVAALTTVTLNNLTFQPLLLFGLSINVPPVSASLTFEDGECSTTGDCGSSN